MVYNPIAATKQRLILRLERVIRARALATGEWYWTVPVMAVVSGLEADEIMWIFNTSQGDSAGAFLFHRPTGMVYYEPCDIKPGPKTGKRSDATD